MQRDHRFSGFMLCFVSSAAIHLHWLLPAALLLAAHFAFRISIWWAVGALALFLLTILFRTALIDWAGSCRQTAFTEKPNRNPYSAGPYKPARAPASCGTEEQA